MSKEIVLENAVIATLGEKNRILEGEVLIRDGAIAEIGKEGSFRKELPEAEYIDCRRRLVMPGFVNAHHHLYSTFARGLSPKDPAPYTFVEILERLWWPLDKALERDDIHFSALIPLIDCVKKGTTTIIDHHESQGVQNGILDELARAAGEVGVRASFCLGVSDRYGKGREGVEENARFAEKLRSSPGGLLSAMFGLHAAFTVEDETLDFAVSEARRLGVGFHTHVAEASSDQEESVKRFGVRVLRRLRDRGVLGPKSLAIHCVHIDSGEMEILRETGTAVAHNPQSNMNNAVGVAPVLEMLEKGILVGLGTDGMSSNMLDEVRVANILHKLARRDPRVGFVESCRLLLENNPAIASRQFDLKLGVIEPGAAADLVVMDYIPPTPLNPVTFLGHFLFGICGAPVDTTIINGRVLMRNKELIGIDEERIAARSRELAEKFWRRF